MKLRNKQTGEIGVFYANTDDLCVAWTKDDGVWTKQEYNSLAELNEEWEDYEEMAQSLLEEEEKMAKERR